MPVTGRQPTLLSSFARFIRPRWSFKYAFFSSIVIYISYCWLFAMPLLSSNLPPYTGPYDVGAIDIEAPCDGRRTHNATFKKSGKPAFQVWNLNSTMLAVLLADRCVTNS